MEAAWSNGKPAYRCRHGHTTADRPDEGRPKNAYVREDRILPHLPALHLLLAMRMWELAEHASEDPQLPLTVAAHYKPAELDLYDYLFTTAPTLRDGFDLSSRYLRLLTTNARLEIEAETDGEVTYSYRYLDAGGRGAELGLQFSAAVFCARASAGTGQPVAPIRVAFTQPAPRSHRAFSETFGTSRVDFGAPVTTFTFRSRDLNLPMPGADPALARILTSYAATLAHKDESLV